MRPFVKRDLDGFFGLFIDNLVQLLLIIALCQTYCGLSSDFIASRILPGVAVSLLLGNLFYAIQAHVLARRDVRHDVTALPYGVNTPSLLVYIFFVMAPVYQEHAAADPERAARLAWQMGLVACLGSGVIEFLGAFVAGAVREHTPRAALLSTLSGIALAFISMPFALQIWSRPVVAMVPLAIVLLTLFAGSRFPLGLPGGLVAIGVGTAIAWLGPLVELVSAQVPALAGVLPDWPMAWLGMAMDPEHVARTWQARGVQLPVWAGDELIDLLRDPQQWLKYLSVIIPMGLFNVIGSLQNIESAEAAGDQYDTASSLAVNGMGTIAAALFGSCFPTTIYIGHPGWKGLGARAGYSTLNGLAITLICLTGTVEFIKAVIPLEAGIAIVVWIGIVITAQAFQASPHEHAPAVAIGLFPAIAAWGATVVVGTCQATGGKSLQDLLIANGSVEVAGFLVHGLLVLERGFIFTCMVVAALSCLLIDRRFFGAAVWSLLGAVATLAGLTHAYQVAGNAVDSLLIGHTPAAGALAYRAAVLVAGYLLMALVFTLAGLHQRRTAALPRDIRKGLPERRPPM